MLSGKESEGLLLFVDQLGHLVDRLGLGDTLLGRLSHELLHLLLQL